MRSKTQELKQEAEKSKAVAEENTKIPQGIGLILGRNMGLMLMAMVRKSNASIVQRL